MPCEVRALGVGGAQTELDLLMARDRIRPVGDPAAVVDVDGIADGAPIRAEHQQRTDGVHVTQDSSTTGRHPVVCACRNEYPGDDLFSQGVAPQVSSALESLTSVFGMGTGGSSPLASPG